MNLLTIAQIVPKIPFGEIAGSSALVIVLLYVILTFILKLISSKKKDPQQTQIDNISYQINEIKTFLKEIDNKATDTKEQLAVLTAHYESEERFKKITEEKITKVEKILLGNGSQSLSTKIDLMKKDIENLQNATTGRKTTK